MKQLILIAISLLLAACDQSEHQDLRAWMKENSKDLRGNIAKLPPVIIYQAIPFDTQGHPDPFSVARITQESRLGQGKGGALQPNFEARDLRNNLLERYPLESMRLIGFLRINHQPLAVIQADQHVKQVRVGDYIGQDFGIIVNISESEVTLRELIQDSGGDWIERTSTLLMQSKEEGKK